MITINVNGETISINAEISISELLNSQQIKIQNINSVAVVLNDHVLPRSKWENVTCKQNDNVQVFKAVAGG